MEAEEYWLNRGDLVGGMNSVDYLMAKDYVLDLLVNDCFFNPWVCHSLMFSTTLRTHMYLLKYLNAILTAMILFF